MALLIRYGAQRFVLDSAIERQSVLVELTRRLNHAWRRRDSDESRPEIPEAENGAFDDYDPFVHFRLADGGMASFHIHDAMYLVVEETEPSSGQAALVGEPD
jgi:hypothetical protein